MLTKIHLVGYFCKLTLKLALLTNLTSLKIFIMTLRTEMALLLLQQKEEDVQNGAASAALKTEANDTPLINWSAPNYQRTVYALISLNFMCFLFGCAYEVFRRKYFKRIKNKIKPESIRKN